MNAKDLKIGIDYMDECKKQDEGIFIPKDSKLWKLIYKIVWLERKIEDEIVELEILEDEIDTAEAEHAAYDELAAMYQAWDDIDETICRYTEQKEALKFRLIEHDIELTA